MIRAMKSRVWGFRLCRISTATKMPTKPIEVPTMPKPSLRVTKNAHISSAITMPMAKIPTVISAI